MEVFWIVVLIQAFVFGAFSSFIAKEKNRDAAGWFWLGFLFSFIALLALIAVPKLEKQAPVQAQEGSPKEHDPVTFRTQLISIWLPAIGAAIATIIIISILSFTLTWNSFIFSFIHFFRGRP